jgi:hypothetical protein
MGGRPGIAAFKVTLMLLSLLLLLLQRQLPLLVHLPERPGDVRLLGWVPLVL